MKCRCMACQTAFEIPKVAKGDREWMQRAIALSVEKHLEVSPGCGGNILSLEITVPGQPGSVVLGC